MSRTTRRTLVGAGAAAVATTLTVGMVSLTAHAETKATDVAVDPVAVLAPAATSTDAAALSTTGFTGTKYVYKRTRVAPPVKKVNDPTIPAGRVKVAKPGKHGLKKLTFRERYVDGTRMTIRYVNTRITIKPQPKVVKVGTKGLAASRGGYVRIPPNVNATTFRKAMAWAGTSDVRAVRQCEAGGNYRLQDSPYYGAYQFLTSTWRSMGGGQFASRADLAPSWAQDYVAYKLYQSQGWGPWTCARITGVA
jgi:hypothetical protein